MGLNWVWCGICAKYLTFDTYPTSTVGALMDIPFNKIKHPIIIWCKIFPFLAKKKKWKCGEDFGWPNIRPLILEALQSFNV